VLLLGDDLRPGAGCGCTDAIHLVGIPAGGGSAVMLDIPRDTRANIPGHGVRKINEAFQDGPQAAADTVGSLVGVSISYVISVGFDEFPQLVDDIGGVTVDVDMPMADKNSGAFFDPGPRDMNGREALAFSRARHLGRGDFTRTEHQGQLIIAVLAKFRAQGTSTVNTMKYLGIMMRYTQTDGISTADLLRLGRLALSIDPANVRNVVMPGQGATIGGVSYVVTSAEAPGMFADFADDAVLQSH
jgi:LCP family protein required for cell wall assembly